MRAVLVACCLGASLAAALCAPQQPNRVLSGAKRAPSLLAGASRQPIAPGRARFSALRPRLPQALRSAIRLAPPPAPMPTPEPGLRGWLLRNRTILLLTALVLQKCVTDILTNLTRRTSTYSATSVALLSEIAKFPLLIVAVAMFGGGWRNVKPTLKATVQDKPFSLVWVSLCYSAQNILYFLALSHLSAESYQVLSQSKLLFTAGLMMGIMQTRLRLSQWGALTMLIAGSLLVQLSEASKSVVAGGNAYLGGLWAILGSLLSSLPNVYYEKLLKEKDTNEWARNIQMTFWIFLWILCSMGFESKVGLDLSGFTANVWLIIALKALNCLLIPATLKYADNILYSYAKPTSIVLTCALSSMVSGSLPAPRFVAGMVLVLASIALYNNKPTIKAKEA